jgi:formamidopyrimidine-DNA glycosylase
MLSRTITAAAALAAAVAVCAAVRRERRLHAQLARERAASRLTAGCLHRDMAAFQHRIGVVLAQQAVLAEAGQILDAELALHHPIDPNRMEGGL